MQPARQGESLEPAEDADTDADGAHVSRIGAGLTSMRNLPELLTQDGSLTSLCLHGNAISRIEGLHQVHGRRCSASCIASSATTTLLACTGKQSIYAPPQGDASVWLKYLHPSARTSRAAALAQAHQLIELNLSSNALTAVEGLAGLSRLEVLDLASNRLREVAGLDGLRALRTLNLAHNRLASLAGLAALQVPWKAS